MTNSDDALGIIIIIIAVLAFFFLRSKGIHMSFGMKYKGGRWMSETKTTYIRNSNDDQKAILDYKEKLSRPYTNLFLSTWKLRDLINEAQSKDSLIKIKSKTDNVNTHLLEIFDEQYAQKVIKILKDDFKKFSDEDEVYTKEFYESLKKGTFDFSSIPSKRYLISEDSLQKLIHMCSEDTKTKL